jgi:hypothetical protein
MAAAFADGYVGGATEASWRWACTIGDDAFAEQVRAIAFEECW